MPKANEHVVVIGGTSGIGLPLARAARALGCTLTIAGRGVERASEIAKSMGPGVTGCHLDLASRFRKFSENAPRRVFLMVPPNGH